MIDLELRRRWLTLETTIGDLLLDRAWECFICEDRYRAPPEVKVPRATCIPLGRYRVLWTWSPRFQRFMLLIDKVPGFAGIRIHAGNGAADTEGCPLPGRVRALNRVLESALATKALEAKLVPRLEAGEEAWLTITLDREAGHG